jgi:hypothetical protein
MTEVTSFLNEHSMIYSKSFLAALAFTAAISVSPVKADTLSPQILTDSFWLPKQREPTKKAAWVKMHIENFRLLAGKDDTLDESDLTRQRQASKERTELRARISFLSLDNDLDGTITLEEMTKFNIFDEGATNEGAVEKFTRADENKDNEVSKREWINDKLRQQFARDKENHDYVAIDFNRYWSLNPFGKKSLTVDEYEASLGQIYHNYDTNQDDNLSDVEARAWQLAVVVVGIEKLTTDYPELLERPETIQLIDDIKKQRNNQ